MKPEPHQPEEPGTGAGLPSTAMTTCLLPFALQKMRRFVSLPHEYPLLDTCCPETGPVVKRLQAFGGQGEPLKRVNSAPSWAGLLHAGLS